MADLKKSIKDEMNSTPSCIPAKWNRFTVADGDWMQAKTMDQLMNRDDFLADKIGESNSAWQDALSSESATRYSDDQYLSASISSLSGEFYTFSADDYYPTVTALRYDLNSEIERATQAESTLSGRISLEETTRSAEDVKLQKQIDELQAATDVIAVFGTYPEFTAASAGSWQEQVTDNDFIKVLRDSAYNPTGDDDADTSDDDYYQVYYQWHISAHDGWDGWSAIGNLDPYYSVAEIDEYKEEVANDFDSLSATVANNYLSANDTAVSAGKNIIVTNETGPKVGIKTKDDVSFSSVSATGFSGTNISGVNQHDTIDNLFGSAYSGAEASAWIYDNSARLDIQAGYGLETGVDEGHLVIGLHQDHCDYYGHSLALGSWSIANGNNSYAFGMSCVTKGGAALAIGDNARATTGAVALGTYNSAMGKYSLALGYNSTAFNEASVAIGKGLSGEAPITLGTWNDNVAGATFIIGDGTGTQEGNDVVRKNALVIKDGLVSGRDFSAGNVSLSSLTNLSAFGNGITNTATFNLSAVKLSAGEGIGFKEDTNGVLSITAEGRAYTGENYVKVDNTTKKISLSGELVNSAKSGQSAYNWITTKSATLSAGSGINFNSAAQNTLGISVKYTTTNGYVTELDGIPLSAGANYTQGRCIPIDAQNKINLSSDINLDTKLVIDHYNSSDPETFASANLESYKLDFSGSRETNGSFRGQSATYRIDNLKIDNYSDADNLYFAELDKNKLQLSAYSKYGGYSVNTYTNITNDYYETQLAGSPSNYYLKFDGKYISAGSNTGNVTAANWASIISAANGRFVSATSQEIVVNAPYKTKFVVTSTIPGSLDANTYYII